jgi:hypothetical protein
MLSYPAAHSAGQILGRFLSGLVWVRGIEWVWPFLLVFLCLPRRWLTYFRVGHEVDYILANRPMIQQRADIVYAYLTYTPAEGVQH